MLGTNYPALDLFWTLLEFFLFVIWVWLIVVVIGDVFRSAELSGSEKALWTLFVIVLPWVGVVVYLIARGNSMLRHSPLGHRQFVPRDLYAPPTALSSEPLAGGGVSGPRTM